VTAAENPDYMIEDLDIFGFELTPNEMQQLAAIK
jgi:diketogulonate reductase-like aldo/keto reductase